MRYLKSFGGLCEGLLDFKKKSSRVPISNPLFSLGSTLHGLDKFERQDFNQSELKYLNSLSKMTKKRRLKDKVIKLKGGLMGKSQDSYKLMCEGYVELIIRKYDDEWYYVSFVETNDLWHSLPDWYQEFYTEIFKCDTFEGVKQLMEFLRIS